MRALHKAQCGQDPDCRRRRPRRRGTLLYCSHVADCRIVLPKTGKRRFRTASRRCVRERRSLTSNLDRICSGCEECGAGGRRLGGVDGRHAMFLRAGHQLPTARRRARRSNVMWPPAAKRIALSCVCSFAAAPGTAVLAPAVAPADETCCRSTAADQPKLRLRCINAIRCLLACSHARKRGRDEVAPAWCTCSLSGACGVVLLTSTSSCG